MEAFVGCWNLVGPKWKRALVAGAAAITVATTMGTAPASAAAKSAGRATTVNASGQAMPVGDLAGWKQVFRDEFRTAVPTGSFPRAVSTMWGAYDDGWTDTSKFGTYMPSKVVSIHDGVMDLNLRTEKGVPLVSAPVPKLNGTGPDGGQLYGRYAVRYRSDAVAGYKIAWLLWPDSDQWSDGEIDFPEADLVGNTSGFMHHKDDPTSQDAYESPATLRSWHTAVIEWTPRYVKFILDGKVIGTSTDKDKIPNKPMHWVLQTETAINGRRPPTAAAGHLLIDWVAAYRMVS
jgi:beta-glucanase (GH16 family)